MKLTDEQIAKLIYEAYRTGRAEGMEIGQKDGYADGLLDGDAEGYERGYEEGWDKGYDAAEKDAEDTRAEDDGVCRCPQCTGIDDEDEYACKCSQCTNPREYDAGWSDGYVGSDVDPDMKENEAYMDGYLQGRDDRETKVELE
jgi:hypothetical protein